jgi:hypothetical protein
VNLSKALKPGYQGVISMDNNNTNNSRPNIIRGRFNSLPQDPQAGRGQVPDAARHSRSNPTAKPQAAQTENPQETAVPAEVEPHAAGAVVAPANATARRSLIAAPPQEGLDNLKRWGLLAGGIVTSPLRWLFDSSAEEEEWISEEEPPLSPGRRFALVIGGVIAWLWSAVISQDVMNNLFPFVREANSTNKSDLFKAGMTLQWKAILASLVFCLMLSLVELIILRRKHKSRARRVVLYLAITVDIVFNAVGYASFMGHSRYFEWNPLAPFLFQNKPVEWGSVVIEVAALINALLPEILWSEASRRKRTAYVSHRAGQKSSEEGEGGRGQLVLTPQGWKWFSEAELKQATKRQKKVAAQVAKGQGARK